MPNRTILPRFMKPSCNQRPREERCKNPYPSAEMWRERLSKSSADFVLLVALVDGIGGQCGNTFEPAAAQNPRCRHRYGGTRPVSQSGRRAALIEQSLIKQTIGAAGLNDESFYPLEEMHRKSYFSKSNYSNVNVALNVKIIEGLDVDLRYQLEKTIRWYRIIMTPNPIRSVIRSTIHPS